MRIVVFEPEARDPRHFGALEARHDVVYVDEPLGVRNAGLYADAEVVSPFVASRLTAEVLSAFPKLALVATRSTGTDHIDTAWCDQHGVPVVNVPTYGESTVAEHVFALLLAVAHRLPEAVERARRGPFSPHGLQGFDLAGKTLGLVGTGRIGHHVARIGRGFEMEVLGTDVAPDPELSRDTGLRYVDLDELLSSSDVVSLHVPSTPATRRMISDREFGRMRQGTVLINTARGDVVDTPALVRALKSGRVAAAGLDVLSSEPLVRDEVELIASGAARRVDLGDLVADHVLLRMPQVIVTPHSAFNTREAVGRIAATTVENIQAFLDGRPRNVVAGLAPLGVG